VVEGVRQWESALPRQIPYELNNVTGGDFHKGTPGASITIVEFLDFECPSCKKFFTTSDELLKEFEGKVLLVMKNYPLDKACNPSMDHDLHKNSCYMAEVSRCAGEQGKYWDITARFFAFEDLHDDSPKVVTTKIKDVIKALSLDEDAIASCVQSGRYRKKLLEDIELADSLGIPGTPFIMINGRPVPSNKEVIQAVIRKIG
jgi:protein-disulfide isomerase